MVSVTKISLISYTTIIAVDLSVVINTSIIGVYILILSYELYLLFNI